MNRHHPTSCRSDVKFGNRSFWDFGNSIPRPHRAPLQHPMPRLSGSIPFPPLLQDKRPGVFNQQHSRARPACAGVFWDGNSLPYLVEPFHDHVGEVFVQHGRGDDHLVEGLVVPPDGKVSGIFLLTAAGKGVQTTGKMGWKSRAVFWHVKTAGLQREKKEKQREEMLKYILLQNSASFNRDMIIQCPKEFQESCCRGTLDNDLE